ncbi:MAG: cupin domain-containing protein [Planctomycetes bacterium]|nr:cupin domain-containing protein [Planctomycetota bacterium]
MPLIRTEPVEIREDARGALSKFGRGRWRRGPTWVELRPGTSRGHHWHARGGEWFVAVSGVAVLVVEDPSTGAREQVRLDGLRARVEPGLAHALYAEAPALVLALADRLPEDDETTVRRGPP